MVSVTLEHVTKAFGEVQAVRGVSLEIKKGELFFMLGPSGCGKTTVLRMIAGFYQPDSGKILFDDRDISHTPPHKRNTGMVFQNYALWPHMTVRENVGYGLALRRIPPDEQKRRVDEALEMVRMTPYAERSPNQLSGGQQQRVALARALVINPDVVLLDEPLSNLDARLRLEMRDEIRRIHDEIGATMIYVTHDQKEALSLADRMAVMGMGEVQQIGDPRAIYTRPANAFIAGFIGEANLIPGTLVQDKDRFYIDTPVGRLLTLSPIPENVTPDAGVMCCIRPEAFHIQTGNENAVNNISATVTQIMYLGEFEQYTMELEDKTRVKALDPHPEIRKAGTGDRVRLTVDPAHLVVISQPESR